MFFIKDLKALENDTTRVSIDIKDLKDLRRHLDDGQREGNPLGCACGIRGIPRYDEKTSFRSVGP